VAVDSHFDWTDLGCGESFQQVLHPLQATHLTNDSEQLVTAIKSADHCNQFGYGSHLSDGDGVRYLGWFLCHDLG
jgi:hypothetical protein